MANSTSRTYPPLTTEAQARDFLQEWHAVIRSSDVHDVDMLIDAAVGLEKFPHLDVMPFYLACFGHPHVRVRMNAISGLGNVLRDSKSVAPDQVAAVCRAIYRVFSDDPEPLVCGVAVSTLGVIGSAHKIAGIKPWLIGLVMNPNASSINRINAYIDLIWWEQRLNARDPMYNPLTLNANLPVVTQVDWTWLRELKDQYGSSQDLDLATQ